MILKFHISCICRSFDSNLSTVYHNLCLSLSFSNISRTTTLGLNPSQYLVELRKLNAQIVHLRSLIEKEEQLPVDEAGQRELDVKIKVRCVHNFVRVRVRVRRNSCL